MAEFEVTYLITGRASAIVEADSKEEAKEKAEALEIVDFSDELIEWEFGDIEGISPS